jgi:oligopeptide transport system permease protein
MGRYTLRRLLQLIPVLLGTTFLIYWLVWSLPGNPFAGKCGEKPCPQTFIQNMKDQYNLDDPLPVQYGKFLWNILRGNFGDDFNGVPVLDTISNAYPTTLRLALVALAIEALIGILAGVLSGLRRGGFLDNLVLVSTLFLISVPTFVSGFFLQWLFGVKLAIIRPSVSDDAPWVELLLPGFVLGSISMAYVSRLMRTSIAENIRSDYVRTGVAKGLLWRRVVGVHLLRNSLIPVITFLGVDLGALMGGAIVTEGIFNIHGVGNALFTALRSHDSTVVVPLVTILVLVYLLMNLLVDLMYGVLDPRIRHD